jgi:hypothetical protein
LANKTDANANLTQGLERLQCRHDATVSDPQACLKSLIDYLLSENESILLACQDPKEREAFRNSQTACVFPTLFLNKQVVVLDSPSDAARKKATESAQQQLKKLLAEENVPLTAKKAVDKKTFKKKGHAAPNPLSCKKKTTKKRKEPTKSQSQEDDKPPAKKTRRGKRSGAPKDSIPIVAAAEPSE